ncbi:cyclic pyranopterin monophosphate synthase MoaC [Phytohalomonas tamaricis]|uniref:cyclic pyranopterin monophosphate synthase MoaC n=1 Tax=Phytohalomonas tamaricis TaxID=2081032 RepID=UPI000D0BD5D0|nr:cyclic pyranopterin monophosphate synthase MoaC [Phytohalomonas tamaricis]
MTLTHLNARGEAHMVDVADKQESRREAVATGKISMQPETLALLSDGGLPKGDVLATARIAGIQAAKRTHELIPLCHQLMLSKVSIEFELDHTHSCVHVSARCRLNGRTGVEMEALTAVSVACLTLYDMCKAVDKGMIIGDIGVESKTGGKSGDWVRDDLNKVSSKALPESSLEKSAESQKTVTVLFFAELRERIGVEKLSVSLGDLGAPDIVSLKRWLTTRHTDFMALENPRILCARNQDMVSVDTMLKPGDEVAFFPPVTGG